MLGLPGGTASAIAHLIGVPLVIASGLTIAGIDLWVMILVIAALAIVLLASFERLSGRSSPPSLISAVVAAVITVLAFDVGMGGWMLLLHFNEFMPPATDAAFWFLMQIGVVLGLLTGFPAVAWLARRSTSVTSPAYLSPPRPGLAPWTVGYLGVRRGSVASRRSHSAKCSRR